MTQCQCKLLAIGLPESERAFLSALEAASFHITVAATGKEALQQIDNDDIDLIIVDASLPNPTQLCQAIVDATDAPVSLLLSTDDMQTLDALVTAPIDRFFFKPLAIPEVLGHLHALRRRSVWQQEVASYPIDDALHLPKEMYCCFYTA